MKTYKRLHPEEYSLIEKALNNDFIELPNDLIEYDPDSKEATRKTSNRVLNELCKLVPDLVGGSADVAKSVYTEIKDGAIYGPKSRSVRSISFGIREFAMSCIQNGILLHGGLRTYIGSFFVFSDYMNSSLRMASMMKLPSIYLFSHDSIAVGEDGPTHQPIEQLAMLRSLPNFNVIRPCDARETSAAWKLALLSKETPTAILLSRQALPLISATNYEGVSKGGYIVSKEKEKLDLTIIATGSEVSLALEVKELLVEEGYDIRVVSMPCQELFLKQDEEYQLEILGPDYDKRISSEMLSTYGWTRFAKHSIGVDTFGTSAPANDAIKAYHFTKEEVANEIMLFIRQM